MDKDSIIPTVDLSCFFRGGDENGKKKAKELIGTACSKYGFFQVVKHGVPLELMARALELSKAFFEYPVEEKLKCSPTPGAPVPTGYLCKSEPLADKNEHLLMFSPESSFNVYPNNPPEYKQVLEEIFPHFTKLGLVLEGIVNECLGLPPNFLKEYNHDRSWDFLMALRYFPAADTETGIGKSAHEDGNCITFVFQDEVGGLEVHHDGQWIPVAPKPGVLIVNIGDVIQVLSNNRFKSATHRVVRPKGRSRHSYIFFYNLEGEKWVEPLPQFTKQIGETPKYRGFAFKEYLELRVRNRFCPPSRPEDLIRITHYTIPS
ncbi:flavonol synthase/flavanone 3-hydroxylase-like [Actinidia eriantha]|uniref:flavonol synthase/flavanone 3-hydroxylase-like n=1 Tax=Actinidia eriantha TaxID=165200 RepID=UPI00258E8E96|nr:flavonol synthase/flavanone 3-hydroxylase-like [Actinidia eriantha]